MKILRNGRDFGLVLVALSALYIAGALLFTQGFLLNRLVVPKYSKCDDEIRNYSTTSGHDHESLNFEDCWMKPGFTKAVILVVDALRYDFMLYNDSLAVEDAKSYQNQLQVFHNVMKGRPGHGKLFQFIADPPTTTMQRIKGLTTGSLPTFIDAGSNFASSEITEDNLISQLQNVGKTLVFMGDDTWMGLFPNSFKRSYPFPSFNVKDLHTVDNGVISHLLPEMKKRDWDVIIAHFLGVDHCGHRHGPYHTAMAEKLQQMDNVIRSVIAELDNDTLLVVFGDHGMTKTGDHGGDSWDEIQAGLFVYSSRKSFQHSKFDNDTNMVSQTDIVPTLSLLLGSPIPFPNLGNIIPHLFDDQPTQNELLHAFQLNARQVHRYLNEYSKISGDIPYKSLQKLARNFQEAEKCVTERNTAFSATNMDNRFEKFSTMAIGHYRSYLRDTRELCRSIWARFDMSGIMLGILVVNLSLLASILVLLSPNFSENTFRQLYTLFTPQRIIKLLILTVLAGISTFYQRIPTNFTGICAFLCILFLFRELPMEILRKIYASCDSNVLTILIILPCYFFVFFSNSFVVHEDKVVLFLLQTLHLSFLPRILRNSDLFSKFVESEPHRTSIPKNRRRSAKKSCDNFVGRTSWWLLTILVLLLVLTRLGKLFWTCREEQTNCETKIFEKLTNPNQVSWYKFWISPLLLCAIPAYLIMRLRSSGNLNAKLSLVFMIKTALPLGACLASSHWLLQYLPAKMLEQHPGIVLFQQIIAPCFLYFACITSLGCLIWKPLTVYYAGSYGTQTEPADRTSAENSVVDIFQKLRSKLNDQDGEQDDTLPVVYGLGSVYSSAVWICVAAISLPVSLVLGNGQASSVTLMLSHVVGVLELYKILESSEAGQKSSSYVHATVTWFLMTSYYFFTTGHQATIPSIRFEAAFVGLPGDLDSNYLPGFLIMLNTFGSDVIFTISLPLLVFCLHHVSGEKEIADPKERNKEELIFAEDSSRLHSEMFRACALYQLCKGFKLLSCMLAAAIHRRHLMVWKIFAPRFIFEGVSFIITSVMLVLVYCYVLRVNSTLLSWLATLENRTEHQ